MFSKELEGNSLHTTYDGKMPRVEDGLKGQLLPGSKILPDIVVWLLTLQTAMEMSDEGTGE